MKDGRTDEQTFVIVESLSRLKNRFQVDKLTNLLLYCFQVSTSAALQAYKLQVERITRIANSTTDFTDLVKVDQCALLKENADLVVSLRGALFFDKKMKGTDQIMSSMGFGKD